MKFLNYFLLVSLLALSVGCDKDDDKPCVAGNLEDTIIGQWTITGEGSAGSDVEFKSEGTLVDEDDILLGIVDEPDHKQYVVNSNDDFTAIAMHDGLSLEVDFYVTEYTCDEIILNIFGFELTMTRK